MGRSSSSPSIGAVALPQRSAGVARRRAIALGATVGVHALLAGALLLAPAPGRSVSERISQPMHVVEIARPPAPPPEPVAAPVREAPPPPRVQARASAQRKPAAQPAPAPAPAPGPVAPAQAGKVLAAEAEPEMLDFTGFDIASGDGPAYVGGVTSASGTNTVAVRGDAVAPDGAVGVGIGSAPSQARSVRLPGANWDCPWPDDARAMRADEQEVVIRAVVRADGRPVSVEILSDPGNGFGAAARRCALSARFDAALDASGQPVDSTSPPIRVRFSR